MKKLFSLATALLLALSLTACGAKSGELTFTTGGDQGTYFGFGSVLASQVGSSTDTKVTAITSGGSQANVESIDLGDAQLAFVQSDVMAYAYNGTNSFAEIGKIDNFSTVAAIYNEQVQIITIDPSIQSVADLAGKIVSVGDAGSGVYYNAVDILSSYGLDIETDITPVYESFGTSAESLQDGKIDAAFVVAGAPTNAVTTLIASRDVYLVSLDDAHIDALVSASPYYNKAVISANVYGLEQDTTTVAIGAVIIARDDVSEDDIYNVVSGIYENKEAISTAHAKGAELNLEYAASVSAVPYHAGAAKYFSEKGISVPTK